MADKPIPFSAPMVRALLCGTKTQTRRVLKPQPTPQDRQLVGLYAPGLSAVFEDPDGVTADTKIRMPIMPRDRLWVRETWQAHSWASDCVTIRYAAQHRKVGWTEQIEQIKYPNGDKNAFKFYACKGPNTWRPSTNMPRWASRLTLTVTDVRVQRLQDISEADAIAEGVFETETGLFDYHKHAEMRFKKPKGAFKELCNSVNGPDAWGQNPWVAAYTFTVRKDNIDNPATGSSGD